jgi:hypothetical protein
VPDDARGQRRVYRATDKFVLVLGLLLVSFILYAASTSGIVRVIVTALYLVTVAVAFRAAAPSRRQQHIVWSILGTAAVVMVLALVVLPRRDAVGVSDCFTFLILGFTVTVILRRVLDHPKVTLQTIAGALSAYLLIGMAFASLFGVAAWMNHQALFAQHASNNVQTTQYFSFVTLTTTGYGDLTPGTAAARGLAVLEALIGQIFLVTLVAGLVAAYRPRRADRDPTAG